MTPDHGQRGADTDGFRAVPVALTGGGRLGPPRWLARAARRASRAAPAAAMPLADALGLAVAIGVTGQAGLPAVLYALAVLTVLAVTGLQRLRICLRVADQAGRILAAVALPLLILLPWMPATAAARLALWSAGLVFALRVAVSAALRAAHRHDLLTEPALVIGAGTFGAHIGELMRAHPELGLRPQGYLDFGPPRRDLALPSLGAPDDLAGVVARHGIRRVIVCYAACKDEDLVTVLRACGRLPRRRLRGAAALRARRGRALVVPGRDLGHPADPAAAPRPLARGPVAQAGR